MRCFILALIATVALAQTPRTNVESGKRYPRIVIRGAIVVDGSGTPASGPKDIVIENNTITNSGTCCVGAFLTTNWNNDTVAGNNCTNVSEMLDFTRIFAQLPGEGTIFFTNNTFQNNTQKPGGLADASLVDFVDVPAGLPLSLGNNAFSGNTFLGPTPILRPASMFVDRGGNVCAKGTDPTFPLACGKP